MINIPTQFPYSLRHSTEVIESKDTYTFFYSEHSKMNNFIIFFFLFLEENKVYFIPYFVFRRGKFIQGEE